MVIIYYGLEPGSEVRYYHGMTEVVYFKLDRVLLVKIDGLASNRSDFIRQAVEEKVQRARRTGMSTWDALKGVEGLEISIRAASDKVRRIKL